MNAKISGENNRLTILLPDGKKAKLHAKSNTEFYLPGLYNFVHFEKDDKGKVTGLLLRKYGGNTFFKKD